MVKLPQSNEMSALIFQPSLVRRPTVASMLITLIVSWRGLNIKISFSFGRVRFEFRKSNEVEEKKKILIFIIYIFSKRFEKISPFLLSF